MSSRRQAFSIGKVASILDPEMTIPSTKAKNEVPRISTLPGLLVNFFHEAVWIKGVRIRIECLISEDSTGTNVRPVSPGAIA